MEKYSLFGELLYIGFVCEKGRYKSSIGGMECNTK
jgi:hypothetical protein